MKAYEIMTADVITASPHDRIDYVIKLLLEHNITGLPVIDDQRKVIGIITEGDIIYRSNEIKLPRYLAIFDSYIFFDNPENLETQLKKMTGFLVEDVMTKKVITVDHDATVEQVANVMTKNRINRVPVVKNEMLVGIISRRDIIKSYSLLK